MIPLSNNNRLSRSLKHAQRPWLQAILTCLYSLLLLLTLSLPAHAEMELEPGTAVIFYHHDHLGNPAMVSDHKGRTLWYENTRPYGESLGKVSGSGVKHQDNYFAESVAEPGYTGHTNDRQLGLVYMKARYYDPVIGRFYSNDPVGFSASNPMMFNRYAYGNNNPYRFVDPDGRFAETAWDAFNVGLGVASFLSNSSGGNYGSAALDAVGVVADGAAALVPFVPGGAGTLIKGGRLADAARATDKAADVVGVADKAADVTKGADSKLSRSGAFKEAKQKAGIPRSQNPSNVTRERIRDQEGYVEGRVYEFKGQNGSTTTIREHSLGHKQGNHGPHFNTEVRSADGIKQPLGGNGDSHTYFK